MSDLPEGPYTYETTADPDKHDGNGHVYLCDKNGKKIASIWGPAASKIALVKMIIEAERRIPGLRKSK